MGVMTVILSNLGAAEKKSKFFCRMSSGIPADSIKFVSYAVFHSSTPTITSINVFLPFLTVASTIMRAGGTADNTTSSVYDNSQQNYNDLLLPLRRDFKDTVVNNLDLDFTTDQKIPNNFTVEIENGDTGESYSDFDKIIIKLEYKASRLF